MTTSKSFARGDIVTVEFPFAEAPGSKDRPALVMTAPNAHGDYTVVMISSEQQDDGVSIAKADFGSGSLSADSFVRVRKLYTISGNEIVAQRGTLNPAAMGRVLAKLCLTLGCRS